MRIFIVLSSPGPSQNPVGLQQPPGISYGMTHQPTYNPMQAKAPAPLGPGLYPSGPYQPVPPVSSCQPGQPLTSYPAPPGQPLLTRPPMGSPPSHTPPQSASPGPRLPHAQPTPPLSAVSSSSYYPNPQQPRPAVPAWQYNTAPTPMGQPTSMSTPPRGPLANHVNPAASSAVPPTPAAAAYSSGPTAHVSNCATQPLGPGMPPTSAHRFIQQGKNTKLPLKSKLHNPDAQCHFILLKKVQMITWSSFLVNEKLIISRSLATPWLRPIKRWIRSNKIRTVSFIQLVLGTPSHH